MSDVATLFNQGYTLYTQGREAQAMGCFDAVIAAAPDYWQARNNRAVLLQTAERYEEAFCGLSLGEYAGGWSLHEARWNTDSMRATTAQLEQRGYAQPMWLGQESLLGKTIFLWPEQGYGDTLQLEAFVPLFALAHTMDVQFVSLQLGAPAKQLAAIQGMPIIDLTADLHDWADTDALVANLDLVISCDTAVAHLAAAMGKPTWVLSRSNGCWRWLQDREDSPWYPTVRLFRQKTRGDWESVIAEVEGALDSYNG